MGNSKDDAMSERPGLLGMRPSRHFKVFREEFPAIFRFDGQLFMEQVNTESGDERFVEVSERVAERWLVDKNDSQFETVEHENGAFTINHGPVEPYVSPGMRPVLMVDGLPIPKIGLRGIRNMRWGASKRGSKG